MKAVNELDIANILKNNEMTTKQLASLTSTNEDNLYRLLRYVASNGVFTWKIIENESRWSNNAYSNTLRYDHPNSMKAWLDFYPYELANATSDILYSVRSGKPSFDHHYGKTYWDYLKHNPQREKKFADYMNSTSFLGYSPSAHVYEFSSSGTLMDLGGGSGGFLAVLLNTYPSLKGVLFDLPDVIEIAKNEWKKEHPHLLSRVEFTSGSFLESIPNTADSYLFMQTLHNWNDSSVVSILKKVRNAAGTRKNVKLLISGFVVQEDGSDMVTLDVDIIMMCVLHGAKERTTNDWKKIFEKTGFTLNKVVPTRSPYFMIEAIPIE